MKPRDMADVLLFFSLAKQRFESLDVAKKVLPSRGHGRVGVWEAEKTTVKNPQKINPIN